LTISTLAETKQMIDNVLLVFVPDEYEETVTRIYTFVSYGVVCLTAFI